MPAAALLLEPEPPPGAPAGSPASSSSPAPSSSARSCRASPRGAPGAGAQPGCRSRSDRGTCLASAGERTGVESLMMTCVGPPARRGGVRGEDVADDKPVAEHGDLGDPCRSSHGCNGVRVHQTARGACLEFRPGTLRDANRGRHVDVGGPGTGPWTGPPPRLFPLRRSRRGRQVVARLPFAQPGLTRRATLCTIATDARPLGGQPRQRLIQVLSRAASVPKIRAVV